MSTDVPSHKIVFLRPGRLPSALQSDHAAGVDMNLVCIPKCCVPGNRNSTQGSDYTGQVKSQACTVPQVASAFNFM